MRTVSYFAKFHSNENGKILNSKYLWTKVLRALFHAIKSVWQCEVVFFRKNAWNVEFIYFTNLFKRFSLSFCPFFRSIGVVLSFKLSNEDIREFKFYLTLPKYDLRLYSFNSLIQRLSMYLSISPLNSSFPVNIWKT